MRFYDDTGNLFYQLVKQLLYVVVLCRMCLRALLSQAKGMRPGVDLAEGVLLPLIGGTVLQNACFFNELTHRSQAKAIDEPEFQSS